MKIQRQTTDKLWLENLAWSFVSGELKIVTLSCFGALQILWGYFCLEKNYIYISIPYHFPWVLLAPYRDRKQSVLIGEIRTNFHGITSDYHLTYFIISYINLQVWNIFDGKVKVASHGAFIKSIFWYLKKNNFLIKKNTIHSFLYQKIIF